MDRVEPAGFAQDLEMVRDRRLGNGAARRARYAAAALAVSESSSCATVDVVISNCVINLAADKSAVFREIARVLKPGGRMGVTDVVADDRLTPKARAERGSFVGCIAGALSFSEYRAGLEAVGLVDVSVTPTHEVADGMVSAIVKATKPLVPTAGEPKVTRPIINPGAGCCGSGGCCS